MYSKQPAEQEVAATVYQLSIWIQDERMIIDQPSLQKPLIRGLELIVSGGMWLIFLYFLQVLVTSLFWIAGGFSIDKYVFAPESLQDTKTLLIGFLWYAFSVFLVLWVWSNWNYWKYGRLERRKPRPPVADETVAWHYGVPVEMVYLARRAKIAKVYPKPSGLSIDVLAEIQS